MYKKRVKIFEYVLNTRVINMPIRKHRFPRAEGTPDVSQDVSGCLGSVITLDVYSAFVA